MMLKTIISRFKGLVQAPPPIRLSSEQAIALARRAVTDHPMAALLQMTSLEQRAGQPVWVVRSATVGQTLQVLINDASGQVLGIETFGLR